MPEHFDVAIVGLGPGGEVAADRLLAAGRSVVLFERELIGGECAYWACIPSKTLLRPLEARTAADRAAGASGRLGWNAASDYRDYMIRHLDDGAQVTGYEDRGAAVVKEPARLAGPNTIRAGERDYTAADIILATGTEASPPDLEGLADITAWTNRETYTATTLPGSALIVGGSAVGLETATFLAGYGVDTTLIHRGDRLLSREEPEAAELAARHLAAAGVTLRLGTSPTRARRDGGRSVLELDDGSEAGADVVVFATGRTARTADLGTEAAGIGLDSRGNIQVDEHCRAHGNIWAIGDVTGIMPFTHVAKYQGRIAADAILGRPRPATYEGIPRVVFTDPEIAAAGLTRDRAESRGLRTASVRLDLAEAIARPWTYEKDPRGELGLLVDTERQLLIGAWAVGPQAGEWIHQAALAIRARIPLETLRDQVAQFPTYHEAYLAALDKLDAGQP